jgi:hypothetical protein
MTVSSSAITTASVAESGPGRPFTSHREILRTTVFHSETVR